MQISFLITLLLAAAVCSHGLEVVKDSAGNPVKTGEKYFIQPTGPGNTGGGLVPATKSFIPPLCPLVVTQTIFSFIPGAPVSFGFDGSLAVKTTAVTIKYEADFKQICDNYSKFWAVDQKSKNVIIGGDPEAENAKFTIEEAQGQGDNTYKLISYTGQPLVTITGSWFSAPQVVAKSGANNEKELLVKFTKYVDPNTPSLDQQKLEKALSLRMFPFY